MTVVGIYKNGKNSTLHLMSDFDSYYSNPDAGRVCIGKAVKSIYVGDFDIGNLKVGAEIEIFYGEPVSTKNGAYAPVRKIEVVK
jgi:hypothetical protein